MPENPNPAFFLDRDGVLNVDTNFVHTPEEWVWCDGAIDALRWMTEQQLRIVVVTNQSGIARGRYSVDDVNRLHSWVDEELAPLGIRIHRWLMAPYHPKFDRDNRFPAEDQKPGTGMFRKAIGSLDIDPERSFMAGDKTTDLIPAIKLGITPFFIRSRHEPYQDMEWIRDREIPICNRLIDAVDLIDAG